METCIGQITHYYNRLGVAVLSLNGPLNVNDILHLFGHTTDFYQKAWSMEIDHTPVLSVSDGTEVALKVAEPVRKGDKVYLVVETEPGGKEVFLYQQLREWESKIA